jgi:3-hydroxyisobutyrate dehydrogenase-like beta-hydroxyacid dehydrogenase
MAKRKIGLMSPGDMGQAVAMQWREAGHDVLTALAARSERTQALARAGGLRDVGRVPALVAEADTIVSVMNPAAAFAFADEVAAAMAATGRRPDFLDCNALSPQSKRALQSVIEGAGARFLDGGIVGAPPRGKVGPRLYLSGAGAEEYLDLSTALLSVRVAGPHIGDAAAVKMCFAAFGKGVQAIATEVLVAAQRLGVTDTVLAEYADSSPGVYDWAMRLLPKMPPKAYRWEPEMREIADTFSAVDLPATTFGGVADVYAFVAAAPLGAESPEQAAERNRSGPQVIAELARRPR